MGRRAENEMRWFRSYLITSCLVSHYSNGKEGRVGLALELRRKNENVYVKAYQIMASISPVTR